MDLWVPKPCCLVPDLPTRHTCSPDFHSTQSQHLQHPAGDHPAGGRAGGALCPEAGHHRLQGDEGHAGGSGCPASARLAATPGGWALVGEAWEALGPCLVISWGTTVG